MIQVKDFILCSTDQPDSEEEKVQLLLYTRAELHTSDHRLVLHFTILAVIIFM